MAQETAIGTSSTSGAHEGVVRKLLKVIPIATAALSMPLVGTIVLLGMLPSLALWVEGAGSVGIIVFLVAFSVLCGFALLPTWVAAVVAGWIFGFTIGFPIALGSALFGALLSYSITRRVSGESLTSMIEGQPQLQRLYRGLLNGKPWRAFTLVALLRLPPNSGFAFMSVLLSAAKVPLAPFLSGTLCGLLPRTAILTYASSKAATLDLSRGASYMGLVVGALALGLLIAVLTITSRNSIARLTQSE